jgi:hypothetical protein
MKRLEVNLNDYQQLVQIYHAESGRAAAVLAASFIEHCLAAFIKHFLVKDNDIVASTVCKSNNRVTFFVWSTA